MALLSNQGQVLVFNNGVTDVVDANGISLVDSEKVAHVSGGSAAVDNHTIITNAEGHLEVPFDNDTIYVDQDGFVKAKAGESDVSKEYVDIELAKKQDTLVLDSETMEFKDGKLSAKSSGGSGSYEVVVSPMMMIEGEAEVMYLDEFEPGTWTTPIPRVVEELQRAGIYLPDAADMGLVDQTNAVDFQTRGGWGTFSDLERYTLYNDGLESYGNEVYEICLDGSVKVPSDPDYAGRYPLNLYVPETAYIKFAKDPTYNEWSQLREDRTKDGHFVLGAEFGRGGKSK